MPAFVPQGQRARGRRGGGEEGGYALGSTGSGRTDPALRTCARAGRSVTGQRPKCAARRGREISHRNGGGAGGEGEEEGGGRGACGTLAGRWRLGRDSDAGDSDATRTLETRTRLGRWRLGRDSDKQSCAHARAHARTHAHTRARARTHTRTHTHTRAPCTPSPNAGPRPGPAWSPLRRPRPGPARGGRCTPGGSRACACIRVRVQGPQGRARMCTGTCAYAAMDVHVRGQGRARTT